MNKYITQGGITINGKSICGFGSAIPVGGTGDLRILNEGEFVMTRDKQEELINQKECSMTISNMSVTEEGKKTFEEIEKEMEETERKYEEFSGCLNQLADIYNGVVHELKILNKDKAKNATLMVELYKRLTILEKWMKTLKNKMNSLNKESIDQE